jgi:hypothetical protein
MQPEEAVEVDRGGATISSSGPRHRDRRPQPIVRLLAVGNENVERVGCASLEQADQRLPAATPRGGTTE